MIAGLVQQAMGGALLRVRMEARKAAFAALAGLLVLAALAMAGIAGIIVLAGRYGIIAALLASAGLLLVLAVAAFLVGRRVPGAEATAREVRVEGAIEDVPAPGMPEPRAPSNPAALAVLQDAVQRRIDGVVPPGGQGAVAAMAAGQLAKRPAATLGAAVAVGAAVGLIQHRRRTAGVSEPVAADEQVSDDPRAAGKVASEARVPDASVPQRRRRSARRPGAAPRVRPGSAEARPHDA